MSNLAPLNGAHLANARMRPGFVLEYPQPVSSYDTYEQAQAAVDSLSDQGFPVENLAIVGTDLRQYERVLGRRTWGSVLAQGAASGLSWGLFMAIFLLVLVPGVSFLNALLWGIVLGVVVGMITAAVGYAFTGGRRDFESITQTVALRYEVLAEHKVAADARQRLGVVPDYSAPPPNAAQRPYGQQDPFGS